MQPILLYDIIKATGGVLISSDIVDSSNNIIVNMVSINSISTDSRDVCTSGLFVPILGNKVDGHDFINNAFENGAVCALTEKELKPPFSKYLIKVPNTVKALMSIAEYYRSLFNIPIIAITGSVGKTTTKDLVASVCSSRFNILKTEGNFNNQLGLPLTVFNLDNSHQMAILEMGMSGFGEIYSLSKIAKPSIAMITNIGTAHIVNLGSKEGVLKAKCEIFSFLQKNGTAILNADDDLLCNIKLSNNILWYGINSKRDFYVVEISDCSFSGSKCKIKTPNGISSCVIPQPGKHMILNALSAYAAGYILGLDNDEIEEKIQSFIPSKMRMDIIYLNGVTVINDCYNANPDSMRASLDVLTLALPTRVAIIGDMLELGTDELRMHYDIGMYAALTGIEQIIVIGSLGKSIFYGAKECINYTQQLFYFETVSQLLDVIEDIIIKDSTILIKASRVMHFEEIVNYLKMLKD